MKILAIRLARLGDVVLLLPALASLKRKFAGAELILMTDHRFAPIAELCPSVDRIIAVNRLAMRDGPWWRALRDMAALARAVRRQRFDIVVDFHSFRETNLLSWLSGAPVRIAMKRHEAPYWQFCFNRPPVIEDKSLHVSDMFQKIVAGVCSTTALDAQKPIGETVGERRCGSRGELGRLVSEKAKEPTIVLYVDAPVPERIWPPERFAEVADFAIEKLGASVVVVSSRQGAELAARVQRGSRNCGRLSVLTDLSLPELAKIIASAHLLVSNDTGPMHLGPAVGVRTLGLFSVGYPEHFRPIGERDRFLRANPIEHIQTKDVTGVIEEMWATVDRDLRR